MTDNNLFEELQADLEREKLEKAWRHYGPWVIALAVGIVLATAGFSAYHAWKSSRDQRLTSAYMEAAKQSDDPSKSIALIQKFAADNSGTNMAAFALLRAGGLAAEKNDTATAIRMFDAVAHDDKADPAFRQMGDLLSVQAQMDTGDAAALSARLQPLTEEHMTWRYTAMEDQGYLALRAGDKDKARQIFTTLSQDARAPQSIGERATDILRTLD